MEINATAIKSSPTIMAIKVFVTNKSKRNYTKHVVRNNLIKMDKKSINYF